MSRYELTPVDETEFPTQGRSYADRIIDEMLATEGNTFRLTIYTDTGHRAFRFISPKLLAETIKTRIEERQVGIEVAYTKETIYLRRSCTPPH